MADCIEKLVTDVARLITLLLFNLFILYTLIYSISHYLSYYLVAATAAATQTTKCCVYRYNKVTGCC